MPPWALRILAVFVTGLSMLGSTTYTLAHPKNPNAPLQPPVAEKPQVTEPEPTPAATIPFRTLAPTVPPTPTVAPTTAAPTATARASATPRASATVAATAGRTATPPTPAPTTARPTPTLRPTPVPQITLAAGVRATSLPKVTYTHSS